MAGKLKKLFRRDNCLLTFDVYLEAELPYTKDYLLKSQDGVTEVYHPSRDLNLFKKNIAKRLETGRLPKVPVIFWRSVRTMRSKQALLNFYERSLKAWSDLSFFYFIPKLKGRVNSHALNKALQVRNTTAYFWDNIDITFEKSLKAIYPKFAAFSRYLSKEEIVSGNLPPIAELRRRDNEFIYYRGKIMHGNTPVLLEPGNKTARGSVKGQTAMPGIVTGRVRVVLKKADVNKVRTGDILVASMTTPNFLPAIKRAAGIATDEGGMTSD